MTRALRVVGLAVAALALGGGDGGEVLGAWVGLGFGAAAFLLVALPAGIALQAWRPQLVARLSRAYEARKTAALLVGGGVLLFQLIVVGVLANLVWQLAALVLMACFAYLLVGFAGCSRRTGLRMLRHEVDENDEEARRLRPLVLGWLVRAGLLAVPIIAPVFWVYVVAGALGAPVVAFFGAGKRPATD